MLYVYVLGPADDYQMKMVPSTSLGVSLRPSQRLRLKA